MRTKKILIRFALVFASLPVCFAIVPPYVSNNPSQILRAFQTARGNWVTNTARYANRLFGALALIEFGWSAAVMVLEKADLQSWTAALIRKIMWIGGFYMLLINGPVWIPFIIDSFTEIGQNSSGVLSISPSNVFAQGLAVAGALSSGFSVAGFLTQPAVILALVFAAIIVVVSYAMITIQFLVAMVESYIVVAAGFLFLGFGGSRWTAPYAERYIGLAVSNGVKILVIYLLIAVGANLGDAWVTEAQGASTSPSPEMVALDVMAAALMYMMICWQIPKLFSAVLGGSPALSGGDLVSAGSSLLVGAAALGAAGAGAGSFLTGGGVPSAAGAGSGGGFGSVGGAVGHPSPPGPTCPRPSSGGAASQPGPPPGSAATVGATRPASAPAGSQQAGFSATQLARGLRQRLNSVLPPDYAPHATPPRMDMDHHE